MKSSDNRKAKLSLRAVLVIIVLAAVAMPFITSALAAPAEKETEGFLNPFDLTQTSFSGTGVDTLLEGSSPRFQRSPMAVPARPIRVPYRPRPRSPIWF